MGPDELALLQVLLQSGYTEEQAMQMLSSGALNAPGVAPPAVQQAMGANNNYAAVDPLGMAIPSQSFSAPPEFQDPSGMLLPMQSLPSTLQTASVGVNPTSGFMGQERGYGPRFGQSPPSYLPSESDSSLQEATTGMSDVQTWLADDYIGGYAPMRSPMHSYANTYYGNGLTGGGPGGRGVPVGGVNPNAYMEKERSYGGDARDAQTYGRDFSGDLGAIIRELVNAGRSAAAAQRPSAQRNPSRPSSPGRSASAPGQMKKAAGVQSAKTFTPAATRNAPRPTTPATTKPRTVTAPKPPPIKAPIKSTPAPGRGAAAAGAITRAKSRF
jgi:hypothetical protein